MVWVDHATAQKMFVFVKPGELRETKIMWTSGSIWCNGFWQSNCSEGESSSNTLRQSGSPAHQWYGGRCPLTASSQWKSGTASMFVDRDVSCVNIYVLIFVSHACVSTVWIFLYIFIFTCLHRQIEQSIIQYSVLKSHTFWLSSQDPQHSAIGWD